MRDQTTPVWARLYDPGVQVDFEPESTDALMMFRRSAQRAPDRALLHYFDRSISAAELDRQSDALAAALQALGVGHGDRVALYLQNVPQFVLTLLAAWKRGAVAVPVNPMLRRRELEFLLNDSGAVVLVTLESLHQEVARDTLPATEVRHVITTSELDFLDGAVPPLLEASRRDRCEGKLDLVALLEEHAGERPPDVGLSPDDLALLCYTSGTTGSPKGAMNTHANVVFNSEANRAWMQLGADDVIFGLAPLFHITGLIAQLTLALSGPIPLVLFYRFDPETAAQLIAHHRATFTLGAITAFIAMMNSPRVEPEQLASLRTVYSGGAPIAPATVDAFRERFDLTIRSAYGLTETTAPSHLTPTRLESPVDAGTGALTVGVPYSGTRSRILDEQGRELGPREEGEIAISGPMVVPGYWQRPEETAHAFRNGELRTGDVGFMDEQGWFYVVDRKKDMIIASGYKVWPREVEDVIYMHPAVRESAVVGVPDPYRGETVKAYISLKAGAHTTPQAIIEHCREQLAAYKRPHEVEILDELPKTASGKILRRALRVMPRPPDDPESRA